MVTRKGNSRHEIDDYEAGFETQFDMIVIWVAATI